MQIIFHEMNICPEEFAGIEGAEKARAMIFGACYRHKSPANLAAGKWMLFSPDNTCTTHLVHGVQFLRFSLILPSVIPTREASRHS